jgi:nitroreductase
MNVIEAINLRRSVRAYSSRAIPGEVQRRVLDAMRAAPSACNLQPWHFILVSDAELRRRVAAACFDQMWMASAPLTVVGCGLLDQAYKHMGGHGTSVDVDVAIALDHLTLAAVAEGLGTCWIGAFDEPHVKQILGVPRQVKIVALTPLGYPASDDLIAPLERGRRKPLEDIVSTDRWGES